MKENSKEKGIIEVFPPEKPLIFPLTTMQFVKIVGISKSTFFRWEKTGKISQISRSFEGFVDQRLISGDEFIDILSSMKGMKRQDQNGLQKNKFQWLKDFDPNQESFLKTPTGYLIKFERSSIK